MSRPRLLALDLSLNATGWASFDGHTVRSGTFRPVGWPGHERLQAICTFVAGACRAIAPDLVVLESGFVKGPSTWPLAELAGLVKQQLWLNGYEYALVSPSSRALYATGNGSAAKARVKQCIEERFGRQLADHNEADAVALLAMAADRYGNPLTRSDGRKPAVSDRSRRALSAVHWPALNLSPGSGAETSSPVPGPAETGRTT